MSFHPICSGHLLRKDLSGFLGYFNFLILRYQNYHFCLTCIMDPWFVFIFLCLSAFFNVLSLHFFVIFLPPAAAFVRQPFFFLVLALCLKLTHLCQCLQPPPKNSSLLLCSLPPSIHLSITPTLGLARCLSLVFPLLWFASAISVRAVIAAVSSLGENKVVLCSWRHKRHKRKEPKPKRKGREKEKLKERE